MYETIGLIVALVVTIISLNTAFGRFLSGSKRYWLFLALFFLFNNLTNYYWVEYNLVMHDYPTLSVYFTYLGWNTSFIFLAHLVRVTQTEEEHEFTCFWKFLPIPFAIAHFILYYKLDGVIIAAWEEAAVTAVSCISVQSLAYYAKYRRTKILRKPYLALVCLIYSFLQYGCWTLRLYSSNRVCMIIYPIFVMSSFLMFPIMVIALRRQFGENLINKTADRPVLPKTFRSIINISYFVFLVGSCVGGYLIGCWARDIFAVAQDSGGYRVIGVMIFVFSLGLVMFTAMIMFVAGFGQKLMENNEMRRDKEIAERANTAKSDFLANMSHEIRTPLNAVLGMNEMIINESMQARDRFPENEEKVRAVFSEICSYAGNIRSAGGNLLNIINDILDFSKIEAGKMEIVNSEYKLSSILNDTGNMIAMKADAKGLDFKVNIDSTIPDGLYGDETRVR